ncbi:MAG TPA: DUF5522 domain-containing protein [Hanamia sp.]
MSDANFIEGIHFYYEYGLIVFTENYHLQRGYCCGNGCRHCPYNYENVLDEKMKELLKQKRNTRQQINK